MFNLHPFQHKLKNDIYNSLQSGSIATIGVAPTGAGKTVIMSSIASDINEGICIIAHRQELVQQISNAVARAGVYHNIIASDKTLKYIINQHIIKFGKSFFNRHAHITVAGVNTLNNRSSSLIQWANTIKYWMIDECHHVLSNNQWGKAVSMFKQARGIGFTATPYRCDRKSLHKNQGGVFTDLRIGPLMRELIDQGYLSDYRIFGPPQSIIETDLKIGTSGDFTGISLRQASEQSTITGDIVEHYLKIAQGKRGITFTVDVKSALETAKLFNQAGVPAEAISAKTPDNIRNNIIDKFDNGSLLQLVNVDLFGEGFDAPAVEVVSMGRPTQSLGLYMQQFGRGLRTSDGKTHGTIIDHVGNVKRHGLPDAIRGWNLMSDNIGKKRIVKDPDVMPVTTCTECLMVFEKTTSICPHCGHKQMPTNRSEPEFVDGDLIEFSPALLDKLRGDVRKVDSDFTPIPDHLKGTPAEARLNKIHGKNKIAQAKLREVIALWAGVRRDKGMVDSEIYRRFYHTFGIDVLSAQALKENDANNLITQIEKGYWK